MPEPAEIPTSVDPASTPVSPNFRGAVLRNLVHSFRVELILFVVAYGVLASFSSQRFLRQSEAPHFVYQAMGWLEGRLDLDPQVLPNLEDWACVREQSGRKVRCEGRVLETDRWYVSFPSFPALAMLPFVALQGYQFNDTSFGVFIAALAIACFYSLLQLLSRQKESSRTLSENVVLALTLGFGTLFFYCAIRGEVWFSAEVMGVLLTCLYLRTAVGARRPFLAGLFFSMAVLTRTPLIFSGIFFLFEAVRPRNSALGKLARFAVGAAPLGLLAAAYNQLRFGSLTEFGHRFLYNNRVNSDIDTYGLFHPNYLARNLDAALLKLPQFSFNPLRLGYDAFGLTLLLTLPLLLLVFIAPKPRWTAWPLVLLLPWALLLLAPQLLPQSSFLAWALLLSLPLLAYFAQPAVAPRLHWPLWATVGACALPGLFYQNTGYMQFGFRFSLDYTPYLLLLFAVGAWSLKNRWVVATLGVGVLVNFWGAVAFRGYTELARNW